jgi:cytoskeletal protein CcmA (bactofilin family)
MDAPRRTQEEDTWMARTPFGSKGMEGDYTPAASTMGSSGSGGGLSAFIDQGSEFEGKLSFKDTVRIDGRFRGEITSENTLIVGETGEIEATIRSKTVAVSGSVTGDIVAGTKVVLHKTARVHGNIETGSLVVEDGAEIDGQIKMGKTGSAPLKAVPGPATKDEKK